MPDQLTVQSIEFNSYIGVTDDERRVLQPMRVDVELDYRKGAVAAAAESDDISKAVDYARAVECIIQIGTHGEYRLVERMAEKMVQALFTEFAIAGVTLRVRKSRPQIKNVQDSVGIRIARTRQDIIPDPKPASFLLESSRFFKKGTILDVAAGRGRNALYLAELGFSIDAVDRDEQALQELADCAKERGLTQLSVHPIDLESEPGVASTLHSEQYNDRYDGVLVFFYLYRPLFPSIIQALKPGGVLVYETFLIDNHDHYQHPRKKEYCLEHNELLRLTQGLRVLHYEEGQHEGSQESEQPFTARLVAQKG
ncbi:MAG: dihydroneopterin aldolase [Nitrospirales bacterium]|nr:dihydroneopterin aldolase [Nitrospirales bacterium]